MRGRVYIALFGALVVAGAVAGSVAWRISRPKPAFTAKDAALFSRPGDSERGKQIFAAADCGSCHASPGQGDPLRLGGGLALASPFGTFRSPNISPDPQDGIGRWTTIDLANALISGTSPSQQHLYPSMPYTSYAQMKVDDVIDLMAFLRSLPSVAGRPPPHELPFPFSWRRPLGLWKAAFLKARPFAPDPAHDETWNRGRYLVEALGHCAECHSTRNSLGVIANSHRYVGGPDQEGLGFVPNITPDSIGHWTVQDIETMLTTGQMPDLRFVGSSMVSVVNNTRELPASDRHAIAVYLKSIPPRKTPSPG